MHSTNMRGLIAVMAIATMSACAALNKAGKVSEKLEEARLKESLAKGSEPTGPTGSASALKAIHSEMDFGRVADHPVIPAQGQLALTIVFRPEQGRACSGHLLVEIDSAGGRFTRVPLNGRGV